MINQINIPVNKWYDANFDEEIIRARAAAEELAWKFNNTSPADQQTQKMLLNELLNDYDPSITLLAPVYFDYCKKTTIKEGSFVNHGAYFMDGGGITIGRHCFIGPFCSFYTASHPLVPEERNKGFEKALPIMIEDDVWLGGNVTILPGVTIGKGSTIGAGSLVTRSIPSGVLAMGSPCKVIRRITKEDRIFKTEEC